MSGPRPAPVQGRPRHLALAAAPVLIALAVLAICGFGPFPRVLASRTSPVASPVAHETSTSVPRQEWVWSVSDPASIVATARRWQVSRLLVWVAPGFSVDAATMAHLRQLRARALAGGIEVDALGGDRSWATTPAIAATWAHEVEASGLFSRVHVDIEPYALPTWPKDAGQLSVGLLAAIADARTAGLPVDADIPYWYWQYAGPGGVSLDVAVLREAASITVMAYQRDAATIESAAAIEVADAAANHSVAFVGIDLTRAGTDGLASTLHGLSKAQIIGVAAAVTAAERSAPGFGGLALHDSAALAALH